MGCSGFGDGISLGCCRSTHAQAVRATRAGWHTRDHRHDPGALEADRGYFERSHPIYLRYWPDQPYRDAPTPDVIPPIFEEMSASRLFEDICLYRYRWDQTYDVDAYLDLVRSYSNTYELAPKVREQFLRDIREMVAAEDGGSVVRPLVITLVIGRRQG